MDIYFCFNEEVSYVNKMLDGSTYPGKKLVQFIISGKHVM